MIIPSASLKCKLWITYISNKAMLTRFSVPMKKSEAKSEIELIVYIVPILDKKIV